MTYEDRCHISALLQANFTISEISKRCGFHRSTVYREINRNKYKNYYKAEPASLKAAKRYRRCRRKKIITAEVKELILAYASFGWSPEQVSGRLKKENKIQVSYQTIYRRLYKKTAGWKVIRQRRRRQSGGRTSQQRSRRRNRLSIHQRPTIVEQRKRIGDWERDGMYGANRQQLLIFTDRKSKYTKIR